MGIVVAAALAACAGFVGYLESARIEKRFRRGPLGLPAARWAVGAGVVGAIAAFVNTPLTLAALAGYAGWAETEQFESQSGSLLTGLPSYAWGVFAFMFGLLGSAFTSPFAWLIACALVALGGEVVLLVRERRSLLADKSRLLAEQAKRTAVSGDRLETQKDLPDPRIPASPRTGSPDGDVLPPRRARKSR